MTPKEQKEYDEGYQWGLTHPTKVHGWTRSVAWNYGLKAGQAKAHADQKQWRKATKHIRDNERALAREKARQAREVSDSSTGGMDY